MIKNQLYGKTPRIPVIGGTIQLTEKLDGSNLCIFKKDGEIYYAQRNNMLLKSELTKDVAYKGLVNWVEQNHNYLQEHLMEGAVLCGEFLGMGAITYNVGVFDQRFMMFAKANITKEYTLINKIHDHDKFIYPFDDQIIPPFIGIVPVVADIKFIPNKTDLDKIYDAYTLKVGRNVEGFVINCFNNVSKYVRMKNGKLKEYEDNGRGEQDQ